MEWKEVVSASAYSVTTVSALNLCHFNYVSKLIIQQAYYLYFYVNVRQMLAGSILMLCRSMHPGVIIDSIWLSILHAHTFWGNAVIANDALPR